jgi:hypothetical protein
MPEKAKFLHRLCVPNLLIERARTRPVIPSTATSRRIMTGDRTGATTSGMVSEPTELKVVHHPDGDEMDAYERLLGDAMAGDGTLFARQDGVEAAWTIVEPILRNATPVNEYAPGTWGPPRRSPADGGGWWLALPAVLRMTEMRRWVMAKYVGEVSMRDPHAAGDQRGGRGDLSVVWREQGGDAVPRTRGTISAGDAAGAGDRAPQWSTPLARRRARRMVLSKMHVSSAAQLVRTVLSTREAVPPPRS